MICFDKVKKFCKDNIELIENYEQAMNDAKVTWHCHHRLEIQEGYRNSMFHLKLMNLYYNRPAGELIFLTPSEHRRLHSSGFKHPETSERNRNYFKGKEPWNKGLKGVVKVSEERKERYSQMYKGKHWKIVNGKREWY